MKRTLVFFLALAVALSSCFIVAAPGYNVAMAVGPLEWTQMNNGFADGQHGVSAVAIDPTNTQVVYAAKNYDGVYKTVNEGSLWIQKISGLTELIVRSLAIDPTNTQVVYAGTSEYVFKSTDGGNLWIRMNNGLVSKNVSCLAIDPTDTQVIYAGTTSGGPGSWILKSTTGGSLWTPMDNGFMNSMVYCLAIDPTNTQVIYAATSIGVFKSTNGGSLWGLTALTCAATNTHFRSLAIDPANTQVFYSGAEDGYVYKSTNGGSSWTQRGVTTGTPDILSLVIDPTNTQVIYAGASSSNSSNGGVFRSTNGGSSWTPAGLAVPYINCLAMDPTNSQVIYAGTDYDGAFRSAATSSGAELVLAPSWNLVSVAIPLPASSIPGLLAVYGYHNNWSVPTTLTPGEAYWVQVENAVTVPLAGTPSTTPVSLTYQAGWQLLGNPFDVPVPITSITNHGLINTCYSYGPTWGSVDLTSGVLEPGRGYWVNLSAATTLTLTHP